MCCVGQGRQYRRQPRDWKEGRQSRLCAHFRILDDRPRSIQPTLGLRPNAPQTFERVVCPPRPGDMLALFVDGASPALSSTVFQRP